MEEMSTSNVGFMTRAIHAGQDPDPTYGSLATPIYQTSTFCFDEVQDGIDKFNGTKSGYVYSRGGNPTVNTLEKKLAAIEGGEACVVTGSGMGAVGSVMLGILRAGDHVVYGNCVYGCTDVVIHEMLTRFGVEVTPVDTTDLESVSAAIRPNTRMIYFETPTNPTMRVTDIAGIKRLVDGKDIKVVVDNTFAPPPIQYPLACGADIVLHSMTKYLNGHGDVIGGAIIGSSEDIGNIKTYASTKISGSILSPIDAFLVIRGLQTLGLRIQRHCENAYRLARWLEDQPMVERVMYPGLESFCDYELAKKQMNGLYTGMLSFELKEGIKGRSSFESGRVVADNLKLAHVAVSLGDPASLIENPVTMTHNNVPAEELEHMDITPGLFRFSAGLEDTDDLIADFSQAFSLL